MSAMNPSFLSFVFKMATSSTKFHFQQITVKIVVTNWGTKMENFLP